MIEHPKRRSLAAWSILADAARVYRLLFRRSVTTAGVVYTVIAALDWATDEPHTRDSGLA